MKDNKAILERVNKELFGESGGFDELDLCEAYHQAKLKQLAPSDESIQDKIEELFEWNHKEFKGSNEAFIHFKEELAEWMRDQFINPERK